MLGLLIGMAAQMGFAAAAKLPTTAANEMLGIDAPDAFQLGFHQEDRGSEIIEMVVPPETVDNWTKLITLQNMRGMAERVSADKFYEIWSNAMRQACSGLTETHVSGTVDGQHAVQGELSCPLNPETGLPEVLTAVAVQGRVNLLVVQVAFRRTPTEQDRALVNHVMGSLKLCDQPSLAACQVRKASGFVVGG